MSLTRRRRFTVSPSNNKYYSIPRRAMISIGTVGVRNSSCFLAITKDPNSTILPHRYYFLVDIYERNTVKNKNLRLYFYTQLTILNTVYDTRSRPVLCHRGKIIKILFVICLLFVTVVLLLVKGPSILIKTVNPLTK